MGTNGYISVQVHPEDAEVIKTWMNLIGLKKTIKGSDLHATLFYADKGLPKLQDIDYDMVYRAAVTGDFEVMGQDPWKALALQLEGGDLEDRHKQIKKLTGGKHSYDDFKAHVSLKYSPEDGDLELAQSIPFPLKKVRFYHETQEDIDPVR